MPKKDQTKNGKQEGFTEEELGQLRELMQHSGDSIREAGRVGLGGGSAENTDGAQDHPEAGSIDVPPRPASRR